MHRRAAALAVLLTTFAVAGCSDKAREYGKDAPRGAVNSNPADTVMFPDGFSNVSSKCDGPNRVYVIFHGDKGYGSVSIAPNDPRCSRG